MDILKWLASDPDPITREHIQKLLDEKNQQELDVLFSGRLQFGTAGLRAQLGPGPMRMNRVVVQQTTAGLGHYLLQTSEKPKVVIGYDTRINSRIFAEDAACVLLALNIQVYFFSTEIPTPVLAFAVKQLQTTAGIMITASHNPREYNGYKVYNQYGAQIVSPQDVEIAKAIEEAALNPIVKAEFKPQFLGDDFLQDYLKNIATLQLFSKSANRKNFTLAYSPLHGVAQKTALQALKQANFTDVHAVETQQSDGHFPTLAFPNPEEPHVMDKVIELAEKYQASLALANDPDGDRLAVAVRTKNATYRLLTGDEIGVLLAYPRLQKASAKSVVGTTVVSSQLLKKMASHVTYFETLTGFKWLMQKALEYQKQGYEVLFTYEEALGFCLGQCVHDKDGISALVGITELAFELHEQNKTLEDLLEEIARKYGLYVSTQRSVKISAIKMTEVRTALPNILAGEKVLAVHDYLTASHLPKTDMLIFELENNKRVILRPSGTEPKLKCYYELCVSLATQADFAEVYQKARADLENFAAMHQKNFIAH